MQFVHQSPELAFNPRWSVGRSLRESGEPERANLDAFGIDPAWLQRFPHELSGGQLQRVAIVRALTPNLQYQIADEITGMLDAVLQARIWRVLTAKAAEYAIGMLIITHDHSLARVLDARCVDLTPEKSFGR